MKLSLKKYEIPTPFHMADFMGRKGTYVDWKENQSEGERTACRDAFRLEAVDVLGRCTSKPFATGVMLPAFRRMFREYDVPDVPTEPRHPFAWCAMRVCTDLYAWGLRRRKRTGSGADLIEVVFEEGDDGWGAFRDAHWKQYHLPLNTRDNRDKSFVPFQACDYLAWEFRNWARDHTEGFFFQGIADRVIFRDKRLFWRGKAIEKLTPNPVMHKFIRRLPSDALRFGRWEALEEHCRRQGYPKRDTPRAP